MQPRQFVAAFAVASMMLGPGVPLAQVVEPSSSISSPDDARTHGLESLRTHINQSAGVPLPPNIMNYVKNREAAVVLGKALFWDMSVGSDGVQSCASCHFHGGADNRPKNQLNPNITRVKNQDQGPVKGLHDAAPAPDNKFEVPHGDGGGTPSKVGANYLLERHDFPFVRKPNELKEKKKIIGPVLYNSNDVASSMGVFRTDFEKIDDVADPNERKTDVGISVPDAIWSVPDVDGDLANVRRVEPRQTPSVFNAVFNFANFWDGRAEHHFNGVNPFGRQDQNANIWRKVDGRIQAHRVLLRNGSLASQAVGPPQSFFEMSFGDGGTNVRTWPEIGLKLLPMEPLFQQEVHSQDSVLADYRDSDGKGLDTTYQALVEATFRNDLWDSNDTLPVNTVDGVQQFTLSELNFSFFFGVSVMLYEATLVTDNSPFDQWMESGDFNDGFDQDELDGLNVFVGDGKCVNCHSGPEFTNASVRNYQNGGNAIEAMQMGSGRNGLYDNGFYNIAVTPTTDDLGRGGRDLNDKPLAFSRQALFQRLGIEQMGFPIVGNEEIDARSEEGFPVCIDSNEDGKCGEDEVIVDNGDEGFRRVAVDGAFKASTVRNTGRTGPYFHNGSVATLLQLVQFYDRGGNFCKNNIENLDPDIQELNLSPTQQHDLVKFILSLDDDRATIKAAPFDHPQLFVPTGHAGNEYMLAKKGEIVNGGLQAQDEILEIEAVGAAGGPAIDTFLGLSPFDEIFTPDEDGCNPIVNLPDPPAEEPPAEEGICGNGIVEGNEQCDDGNRRNRDSCSNDCTLR